LFHYFKANFIISVITFYNFNLYICSDVILITRLKNKQFFALQDSFSNSKKKTLQQLVDCVTLSCCKSIQNETSQNKNNSTNNPLNANNNNNSLNNNNISNATIVYYDTPDELENLFNATAESISAAKAKSFNKV